ncbi:MAG: hypothetical protein R3F21_02955 [Myxococcota bacterium]
MSEPLDFFGLQCAPFADEAPGAVVVGTRPLRKVVARIQATVRDGGTRIGVLGVAGIGKTRLARALRGLFAGSARVATILDPAEDWRTLRAQLAREWQLDGEKLARASLVAAARTHRLLLVVDRAESASGALLQHLDALQAIELAAGGAAVTVVLFVRSDHDHDEDAPRPVVLDWLERSHSALISFEPLAPDAVADFVERRLQRAGYRGSPLFTPRAALAIHAETRGVPGAIGHLCERLLVDAAARRLRTIDEPFVRSRQQTRPAPAPESDPDAQAEVWDDADHHPRETEIPELLLEQTISAPRAIAEPAVAGGAARRDASAPGLDPAQDIRDPELEAFLSAPPTAAELRAIRGGFLRRQLGPFAALAAAVILGGVLLARWSPDSGDRAEAPLRPASAGDGAPPPVLGRLRGPVMTGPAPAPTPRPASRLAHGAPAGQAVQNESRLHRASDLDDSALPVMPVQPRTLAAREAEPDPLVLDDTRPKDLPPPAGIESTIP